MTLADIIEHYLRALVEESDSTTVEIVRSNLAEQFSCVPSQINYVLTTRFTPERGFLVESRRGGGGHVSITRLMYSDKNSHWSRQLLNQLPSMIDSECAFHICDRLADEDIISEREKAIMQSAMRQTSLTIPLPLRDQVRAAILRNMILALLTTENE